MPDEVTPAPVTDVPIFWFARLQLAVEEGDFSAAVSAVRELARLGVRVQYGRPEGRKAVPGAH